MDWEVVLECLNTSPGEKVPQCSKALWISRMDISRTSNWKPKPNRSKEEIGLKYLNSENTKPWQQDTNGRNSLSQCLKIEPMHFVNTYFKYTLLLGAQYRINGLKCHLWNAGVKSDSSSSLTYGCTKHSNRLQPTLVTKHRGRGFCQRL